MKVLESRFDFGQLLFDLKNLIYFLAFFTMPFGFLINGYVVSVFALLNIIIYATGSYRKNHVLNRQLIILSIALLTFYLLETVSITFFSNGDSEFYRLEKHLIILLFPVLILVLKLEISEATFNKAMKLFVLAILFICLYSEYKNLLSLINDGKSINHFFRWKYSGNNITKYISIPSNYLSLYIGVTIVFLLQQIDKRLKVLHLFTYILLIFFLVFVLLHLASRSIIIGVGLAIVLIVFKHITKTRIMRFLFLIILVSSTFFVFNNFRYLNTKFTRNTFNNPDKHIAGSLIDKVPRLARWRSILLEYDQIGFTGVGVSDAQSFISACYLKEGLSVAYENQYNAHNQFIQTYVELGIVGLIVLIFMFLVPLRYFIKVGDYYSLSVILIFIIFGFTESIFLRQKGLVLFTFLVFSMLLVHPSKLANSKKILNEEN